MKNNKKRSVLLRVTSFMLTMLLISGMAIPAFANDDDVAKGDPDTGTSAIAKITKVLEMPKGTTAPNATFTFKFKPETVEGESYDSTKKNMPLIYDIDILIDSNTASNTTSSGVKTVYKESADILNSLIGSWPHAGSFKYKVTETDKTYTIAPDNKKEWMTYSLAEFEVEFIVDNGPGGTLYVLYIVTTRLKDDKGEEITGGEKVNPNPEGGSGSDIYSQFKFVNTYSKTTGGGEDNPEDSVLDIGNTVKGTGVNLLGTYFNFSVTVNKPEVGYVAPFYMAYVMEKGTIVSDLSNNVSSSNQAGIGTDKNGIEYFKFVPGTSADVVLRHDQKLGFVDVPIGASFKVTLAAAQGFFASYEMIIDGGSKITKENKTDNTPLTAPESGFADIGEDTNNVTFLNDREFSAPTGISVNDLPFYLLIAIAAIALIAFVAIKNSFASYSRNVA